MLPVSSSKLSIQSALGLGFGLGVGCLVLAARRLSTSARSQPPKKSQVYTRTGDGGTSSLYNGNRRGKNDPIFDALGNQDELNAVLGIAREHLCLHGNTGLVVKIEEIQSRLFDVGAAIATPPNSSEKKKKYTEFELTHTRTIEVWIDEMDEALSPLKHFVIPSGGLSSTHLNLARTVCRRTERSVVPLVEAGDVNPEVGRYLNRLSDFLFVASRVASVHEGTTEVLWKKHAPPPVEE
jgi:cob(I)alamin adenosyltransferase